jgi:excisionase family DNA binding protein
VVVLDEATLRALMRQEVELALQPVLAALARVGATQAAGDGDGLLTAGEVVDLLRIDRRTLRRMVLAGEVPPPITIGTRTVRWRRRTFEKWLAGIEKAALDGSRRGRLHACAVDTHTAAHREAAG